MDSLRLGATRLSPAQNSQSRPFVFYSEHKCLQTMRVFEWFDHPLEKNSSTAAFETHVQQAFKRAKNVGIDFPVLVGAIPFDKSLPSSLFIPEKVHFFERDQYSSVDLAQGDLPIAAVHNIPDENRFKQSVKQAIANFQLSDIRKTVLSRMLDCEFSSELNSDDVFQLLVYQNSTGFPFRVPLKDGTTLVGVSPELLLRKYGDIICSNPLAGSAKRHPLQHQDEMICQALLSSAKDLYEHKLVIDDIEKILQPNCSDLAVPAQPTLLSTEVLWHLSTYIEGRLKEQQTNVLSIASKLHPTPAVCGYPTALAHKLINLIEGFDRGLFAGMVGWMDADGNGEWVVTIRCGVIKQNKIRLFAGAGIVEDSCPESEWAETQTKMQTMLRALPLDQNAFNKEVFA